MAFFNSAVTVLQTLVIALGAGLGIWGCLLYTSWYTVPTSGHFGQPKTENQTPPTKARLAGRTFPM